MTDIITQETILYYLLTAALEGGSNYWYVGAEIHERDANFLFRDVTIFEEDEDNEPITDSPYRIHLGLLQHTADKISRGDFNGTCHYTMLNRLAGCFRDPENAMYDAGDADVFLQLACFGEVKYG